MNSYLRAMRLERWPRSAAILVGSAALLFVNRAVLSFISPALLIVRLAGALLLTWGISTANYIINEIADAPFDIHHPTKRNRPLAKGEIQKGPLILWGMAIGSLSLILARLFFPRPFFYSLCGLLAAGFFYNLKPFRTKDIPFLDSVSESVNNPVRFLIGWFALTAGGFPPWSLLLCWWAFGNFLMVAKRLSEFRLLKERAEDYRASLKRYSQGTLFLGLAASAVVFFAAYFYFAVSFKFRSFFYLAPFLALYLYSFFRKTLSENEVMEEPEKLLSRPNFAVYTIFLILLYVAAFFLDNYGR